MADMLATARDRAIARLNTAAGAKPDDVKIDPATLLAIFSAVVQLLVQCKKKDKLADAALVKAVQAPSMMQQLVLRREIIRELGSRSEYRKNAAGLLSAMLAVGAEATAEEALAFVQQATG